MSPPPITVSAEQAKQIHPELVQQLAGVINDSRVAMLTTRANDGRLLCRPLLVQQMGHDGTLSFLIDNEGELARDVRAFPAVNLVFPRSDREHFTCANGIARIDDDRRSLLEVWHAELLNWFPRGLSDPGLVVLRVRIDELSLWNGRESCVLSSVDPSPSTPRGANDGVETSQP